MKKIITEVSNPLSRDRSRIKVALALGGGGVRGTAHIGVIRALAEFLPIDIIAGTSMGAIIGAMYALNPDIDAVEKRLLSLLEHQQLRDIERLIAAHAYEEKKLIIEALLSFFKRMYLLNLRAIKRWVFSGKELAFIFDHCGLDTDFSNIKLPFSCMTVDLRTGEEVILDSGNMREAVSASVALPGVFPPVRRGRRLLIDGGIVSSVPVEAARAMGADFVIGIGVEAAIDYDKKLGNGLDIIFQADAIRASKLAEMRLQTADCVIRPDVGHVSWANFSRAEECIREGEKAAREVIPEIREKIARKRREQLWKGLFPFLGVSQTV